MERHDGAVRARELILKPKSITKPGEWKTRRIPRGQFPLGRGRYFQLGTRWSWRVDILAVDGVECRLLTAFEPSKESFLAWLTYRRGTSYVVVARLEMHGAEPGLHCHASCAPVSQLPEGVVKPFGVLRVPKARAFHRRTVYEITESEALARSFGFFRVTATPEGSML